MKTRNPSQQRHENRPTLTRSPSNAKHNHNEMSFSLVKLETKTNNINADEFASEFSKERKKILFRKKKNSMPRKGIKGILKS